MFLNRNIKLNSTNDGNSCSVEGSVALSGTLLRIPRITRFTNQNFKQVIAPIADEMGTDENISYTQSNRLTFDLIAN